jgi:beta-glucosidase
LDFSFPNLLLDLVQSGEVSESRIDFSVAKILQLKKFVGLLDNPFPDKNSKWIATVGSAQDEKRSQCTPSSVE